MMVEVRTQPDDRIRQGDVLRDVQLIESVAEDQGIIQISRIAFPVVIVLTQDCDLQQDETCRSGSTKTQDKSLLSVLVAPLYNKEHVFAGEHLSELGYTMQLIASKDHRRFVNQNQLPRYHFVDFPPETGVVPSVIDFKHYFSVNVQYLRGVRHTNYVCTVAELYREDISCRFASFLARIGLPNPVAAG